MGYENPEGNAGKDTLPPFIGLTKLPGPLTDMSYLDMLLAREPSLPRVDMKEHVRRSLAYLRSTPSLPVGSACPTRGSPSLPEK